MFQKTILVRASLCLALFTVALVASRSVEAERLPAAVGAPAADDSPSSILFVENAGQWPEAARFRAQTAAGTLWLADDALWLTVLTPEPAAARPRRYADRRDVAETAEGVDVRLSFLDAAAASAPTPFAPQAVRVNRYLGSDPSGWQTDIPVWGGVRYSGLYPGLDLVVGGRDGALALDFVCADACPAVPPRVRMQVEGAPAAVVGDLLQLTTPAGDATLALPRLLDAGGEPVATARTEVLLADGRPAPVVDEPVLPDAEANRRSEPRLPGVFGGLTAEFEYGTLVGGSDTDWAEAIAVDGNGRAVVVGDTRSTDFPTTAGAFDATFNGGSPWGDVFVARFDPTGSKLEYATFIGGSAPDLGLGGAVDTAGAIYVTGWTRSTNFPTTAGAYDRSQNGDEDAYVVKLGANGQLVYSTFIGGSASHPDPNDPDYSFAPSGYDAGMAIAVVDGRAVVAGTTRAADFPTTVGAVDTANDDYCYDRDEVFPCADAFLAWLSPSGSALAYSSFLGGSDDDFGNALAIDSQGRPVVAGDTLSDDFPVTPNAYDSISVSDDRDAFVARFTPTGSALQFATYLGGEVADGDGWYEGDKALAVAVAPDGAITVAGETWSTDFPTTPGAFDRSRQGGYCPTAWYDEPGDCPDAFVTRFQAGGALAYSTLLGGTGDEFGEFGYEAATALQLDPAGNAVVAGYTGAIDFPTTPGAYSTTAVTPRDTFVARLNPTGQALDYSTYLTSTPGASNLALARDAADAYYLTGQTFSPTFPTTAGAWDTTANGFADGFALKFRIGATPPFANWKEVGANSATAGGVSENGGLSDQPVMVEGADGEYYVIWSDKTSGNFEIYARRWNGSAWVEVSPGSAAGGGISKTSGASVNPAVAAAEDGLYVAWADNSGGDYDIYVRRWTGSAWVEVGSGSAAGGGISANGSDSERPSVAVNAAGLPLVAWDDLSGGNREIYVRQWDGAKWSEVGSGSAAAGGISKTGGDSARPIVVIDATDAPVIGWTDASDGDTDVYVRRYNGRKWAVVGSGSASGGGISLNDGVSRLGGMAVAPDGDIYAAWADNSTDDFEIYVRKWDGKAWREVGNGSAAGSGISVNSGNSQQPTVAVGQDGVPYVAWYDASVDSPDIYVRRWSGVRWEEVTAGSGRGGGVSDNSGASAAPSLLLATSGRAYLGWADDTSGDYEIYIRAVGDLPCHSLELTHVGEGADPAAVPDRSFGCRAGEYTAGSVVAVTAAPADGWRVSGWSGTDDDSTTAPSNTVTMPATDHIAFVVYAQSEPTCYALTLTHAGSGSDPLASPTASPDCPAGFYNAGQSIALEAAPASGWRVAGWSGTSDDASSALTNTLVMPAADHVVSVNYTSQSEPCYRLTTAHSGRGGDPVPSPTGSPGCPRGMYKTGQVVTLVATPGANAEVKSWLGTDDDTSTAVVNTVTIANRDHVAVVTYQVVVNPAFRYYFPAILRRP